jgi:hypothetical protein
MLSEIWQVLSSALIFIAGMILSLKMRKLFGQSTKRSIILYCWHTCFTLIYAGYIIKDGGDALGYYDSAMIFDWEGIEFGTNFIILIVVPLVQILNLSFIGCSLVFGSIGGIGILALDAALQKAVLGQRGWSSKCAAYVVFLPSINFWTSGIGKDAVAFLALCLSLWAAINMTAHIRLMIFSILLMLTVRPHIAGIMIFSITASILFSRGLSFPQKMLLGTISILSAFFLLPYVLQYVGLQEDLSLAVATDYVIERQSFNLDGGSSIDISNLSFPMQLFTYMFRPTVFDAQGFLGLVAAIDNMVLSIITLVGACYLVRGIGWFGDKYENRLYMWIYVCVSWVALSITTANLGISLRQKWMIAPVLIYILFTSIRRRDSQP